MGIDMLMALVSRNFGFWHSDTGNILVWKQCTYTLRSRFCSFGGRIYIFLRYLQNKTIYIEALKLKISRCKIKRSSVFSGTAN